MILNNHRIQRALLFPLILFIAICVARQGAASDPKSFIWEIHSGASTVFVLGSVHAAKPEMYPLSHEIEEAFKKSSCLAVEVNALATDEKKMQRIIAKKGYYPEDDHIRNHLPGPLYSNLTEHLEKTGIPLEAVSRMRPGFLSLTLTAAQIVKMGYLPEHGVDLYFLNKAKNEKPILELETMEEQLSLLLDMPDENLYLEYTLSDLEKAERIILEMNQAWLNGDVEGLYNTVIGPYISDPRMRPLLDRLFFDRNRKMAAKIKDLLKTGRACFVVVGAGHLVGDEGIIELLKKDHYQVRQLGKS